jgi:hypothetical protein
MADRAQPVVPVEAKLMKAAINAALFNVGAHYTQGNKFTNMENFLTALASSGVTVFFTRDMLMGVIPAAYKPDTMFTKPVVEALVNVLQITLIQYVMDSNMSFMNTLISVLGAATTTNILYEGYKKVSVGIRDPALHSDA